MASIPLTCNPFGIDLDTEQHVVPASSMPGLEGSHASMSSVRLVKLTISTTGRDLDVMILRYPEHCKRGDIVA